jgi:malonyl-CoA O-methyltransferase
MNDWLDRRAARRTFDRAAARRGESFIAREIERRVVERLDYIKHAPRRVVDAGCGAGEGTRLLRSRYPGAEIVALDLSGGMLDRARGMPSLLARLQGLSGRAKIRFVRGDFSGAALASASCDMLWSNLALAWSPDPAATIAGWGRVLAPESLLMFSTFGPDTLRELAAAFRGVDALPHVHPFVDMHDLGDMLVAAGFAEPVMDMEMITLTYDSPARLFAELREAGYANVHAARRRGLTGRRRWHAMLDAYGTAERDGRLPASFEVVYGHAWKGMPRKTAEGHSIVRFDRARQR